MRRVYDRKDLYLTLGGLVSDYVVVTTNHKKSAEVIVDGNIEGPNEIQFMSFTNCKTVPQNSPCLSKEA